MNKEQKEQLRKWGVNPKTIKEPKSNNAWKILAIVLAILFAGTVILYIVTLEDPVNKEELQMEGFQAGILYAANYTTNTRNFTYIENYTVKNMNLDDYCIGMIQNINEVQNGK